MSRPRRRDALRRGRTAETLCALSLWLRGYRILARNYRSPVGEIDLIARRGRVLAFIEVKARPTLAEAAAAPSVRQFRRIRRAAEHFLSGHPALAKLDGRFDAMLLASGRFPRHIINAWGGDR